MPIVCPITIRDLGEAEFNVIDRSVMGQAFASQNELGRLCDEKVYENDLAFRLRSLGHHVETQVPIVLTHLDFEKRYAIDLICDHAVYDTKTVLALTSTHDMQILHYAMLLNVRRAKLLNFRNQRVEGRLRNNVLTRDQRHQVRFEVSKWCALSDRCEQLRELMIGLLRDWGAFLDSQLYEDALIWFNGRDELCRQKIHLHRGSIQIGWHEFLLHADRIAFLVTAVTRDVPGYQAHLERLLRLTDLRGLQWINLCHHEIQFVTLIGKRMQAGE